MNKTNGLIILLAVFALLTSVAAVSAEWSWDTWCNCGNSASCWGNCSPFNNYRYYYNYNTNCYRTRAYQAEFIKDVTIPDGSRVAAGRQFVKTWRVRNVGTNAWYNNSKLVFVNGNQMGASSVAIPTTVAPGSTVDITVYFNAPTTPGMYRSEWMFQSPDGQLFGVGCGGTTPIWAEVYVGTNGSYNGYVGTNSGYNSYVLPAPLCTCPDYYPDCCKACTGSNCFNGYSEMESTIQGLTISGRNPYCNNKIRKVQDVTVPDGSVVAPGSIFRKTWSMKNGGTCVWDMNYALVFDHGDNMGATFTPFGSIDVVYGSEYQGLRSRGKVYPGDTIRISIDLKAPTVPGTYKGYYRLRDNYGYGFGFGSYAVDPFWVEIVVANSVTAKDADAVEPQATEEVPPAVLETPTDAALIAKDADIMENACDSQDILIIKGIDNMKVVWSARNAGSKAWDTATHKMVLSDSSDWVDVDAEELALPTTASGERAEVSFPVRIAENAAPEEGEEIWLEYYLKDEADQQFCRFYFKLPFERSDQ